MPYHPRRRKIALLARFGRQAELRLVRDELHRIGYEVLSSWLDEDRTTEGRLDRAGYNQLAHVGMDEMIRASVVACFIDAKDNHSRGGHQAEFGYALAKGKVCISVGSVERNLMHHEFRVRQFSTTQEFLRAAELWTNFLPPLSSSREPQGHLA